MQKFLRNSDVNAGGVGKIAFRPTVKSASQTPYRQKFVFVRHGCPRQQRCAGGGVRGVINNFGGSRSLVITVAVQLTSTRLVI